MQTKYAVINVDQDYDYVYGADCLASFESEKEANDYIQAIKAKQGADLGRWLSYIEGYVDSIQIPEFKYDEWLVFIKKWFGEQTTYVFPKDFKDRVKDHLKTYGKVNFPLEDYNPPPRVAILHNLFVVEIK